MEKNISTKRIPFQYGQTIKIKRLNRQWKGKFPKDPYEKNMKGGDVYIDQDTGQLHMYLYWDINADKLTGPREYCVLVEVPVDQSQFVAHAPKQWYTDYAGPQIHRPKSSIKYFLERSLKGDKDVDVDWCNKWLQDHGDHSKEKSTGKKKDNSSNDNSGESVAKSKEKITDKSEIQ